LRHFHSPRRLLTALAVTVTATAGLTASAHADISTDVYKISPGHTFGAKALDVPNFNQNNGAPVVQNASNGQLTQQWRIKKTGQAGAGASFYSLSPLHAQDKCLDVSGGSTLSGAKVVLQSCSGVRASQRWHIFPRNPGLFQITNRNSSMTLQVPGASQSNGRQLVQATATDFPLSNHKQFKLTKLSN
jgi:endoglucanase